MKKFALICLAALSLQAQAQTISVTSDETGYQLQQNDVLHYWIPATNGSFQYWDERHFTMDISNPSPITLQIRRTVLTLADPNAEVYFCTAFECTGPEDDTCTRYPVGANARTNLYLDYKTASVPGLTIAFYSIYNINNMNDSFYFTVHYHITTGAVGIAETSTLTALSAPMPNPASSQFAVQYNAGSTSNNVFSIYNMLGKLVSATTLSSPQGIHYTDTSSLPEGVYTCTLTSQGVVTGMQRIVITK
ncbi:MAG: T9SS type A sorting domain-containing protein [Bacteroidia bacterium]|nr:T9SS type A sorting domain-containing protein [Bacteroidia bacterium]